MKRIRFSINGLILGISMILCIIFCLGGCRREETHAARLPEKTPVIVTRVMQISTDDIVFVSGSLEADKTAPLSFLVPGKVARVYVEEGDHVERGQLLASVESDDYRSNLEIAEAAVMDGTSFYNPREVVAEEILVHLKNAY